MLKAILVSVILIVVPIFVVYKLDAAFKEDCRSHGGIPVISRYDNICYASGTIIDLGE